MVIAIILFARLGVRLVVNYKKYINEDESDEIEDDTNNKSNIEEN